jgi:hypothetical protein
MILARAQAAYTALIAHMPIDGGIELQLLR